MIPSLSFLEDSFASLVYQPQALRNSRNTRLLFLQDSFASLVYQPQALRNSRWRYSTEDLHARSYLSHPVHAPPHPKLR
jgi:hypothetical protein